MDACTTRGMTRALPTPQKPIYSPFEEPHTVALGENHGREFIPQLKSPWEEVPLVPNCTGPLGLQCVGMNSLSMASGAMIKSSCGHHVKQFLGTQPVVQTVEHA